MNDLFSERYGYVVRATQFESLNQRTRNAIWDLIYFNFLSLIERMYKAEEIDYDHERYTNAYNFYFSFFIDYYGMSAQDIPEDVSTVNKAIKHAITNSSAVWYITFDIIEALLSLIHLLDLSDEDEAKILGTITTYINQIFEREKCSYKMINGQFVPLSNDVEMVAIAQALTDTDSIKVVNSHLMQAIKHFSNREYPDYRGSMKEAIMALEGLLVLITGSKNDMGAALKALKRDDKLGINPALQNTLNTLYGWSSDEIRHAQKPGSSFDIDDAKLAIVTCCSLISFIIAKAIKVGIPLNK